MWHRSKGLMQFGKIEKLSPRYMGPFEIIQRIGKVAYRLAISPELVSVHNVFHVSMLKKNIFDPSYVLSQELIEMHAVLTYKDKPIKFLIRMRK